MRLISDVTIRMMVYQIFFHLKYIVSCKGLAQLGERYEGFLGRTYKGIGLASHFLHLKVPVFENKEHLIFHYIKDVILNEPGFNHFYYFLK